MTAPAVAKARYRRDLVPELDGLRAIAVLLVLWVHLPPLALGPEMLRLSAALQPGAAGVDLFFVLSGFLITRILLADRQAGLPLRRFMARRCLRIFPIYYLTLLVMSGGLSSAELWAALSYTSNWVFPFLPGYSAVEHCWSLAVEEQFYLLWPPVVALLPPQHSRRVLCRLILPLGLLLPLAAMVFGPWEQHGDLLTELVLRASPVCFLILGLGALVAFAEPRLRGRRRRLCAAAGLALAASWLFSAPSLRPFGILPELDAPGVDPAALRSVSVPLSTLSAAFGSLAALLLVLAVEGMAFGLAPLLRSRILRGIGRISYGLYLYHLPIFGCPGIWGPDPLAPSCVRVLLVLGLCMGLAVVSYRMVEKPLLELGRRARSAASVDRPESAPAGVPGA